jgi:hypothetical protein
MANLEQTTYNAIRKAGPGDRGSVYLPATFQTPTTRGRLILAVLFATGGLQVGTYMNTAGFTTLLSPVYLRDTMLAAWYMPNAPVMSTVSISMDAYRGAVLRLFEVSGVAQSSPLDRFVYASGENQAPYSGQTATLTQSGEYLFGVVGSQYATTSQSGFTGGLTRLVENTVPDTSNEDWERGRVSFHQANATSTAAQRLGGSLSSSRRWIGFLASFKSGATGPVKFSVTNQNAITVGASKVALTVFGRLRVTQNTSAFTGVQASTCRIGPFDYQYRLGGWGGTLIGADTPYPVESVDGLEGWVVNTSDTDFPRADGAIRGTDLQSPREAVFKLSSVAASRGGVEALLRTLYASLSPRRDDDLELIFRHPGQPLRSLYYRPIDVVRHLNLIQALAGQQAFTLRASDPRLYSAIVRRVIVPVTQGETEVVSVVGAINSGNARAYPRISIIGPSSGVDVSRVTLVNATADVSFDVATTLQAKAEIVGDMRARVVGGRTSVVTLNGVTKYGAWQQPREPFYLAPAPEADNGLNLLYLRTVPAGAPVTCTVDYRDTWSG